MGDFKHDIRSFYSKLGWSQKGHLVRNLKSNYVENKDWKKDEPNPTGQPGRRKETILVTDDCLRMLIARDRTRRVTSEHSELKLSLNGIEALQVTRFLPAGVETISFLMQVFSSRYVCSSEYRIIQYRVDLYIHEPSIIIECDEDDHKHYDKNVDAVRTAEINAIMPCARWIRFNPNARDFKLSHVVQSVMNLILDSVAR